MQDLSPAKTWRLQKYRYRLLGSVCTNCQSNYYPYKAFCTKCLKENSIKEYEFKPFGKILSWTVINVAPKGFEKFTPYIVALVRLSEGPIILSQICDTTEDKLKTGLKVKAVFRKLAATDDTEIIKYGLKFEPQEL
jgi:uncharacterized protein